MSRTIEIAGRILDYVGDRAEAEIVVSGGESALTRFANSFIHQNVADEGYQVSLRVAVDGRVNSATTTSLGNLDEFVDDTIGIAALQRVDESWPGLTEPTDVVDPHHFDEATATATPAERAQRVADFVAAAPEMSAAGYCETLGHDVAFVNTEGHRAFGRFTRATIDGIHRTSGGTAGTVGAAGSGHATSKAFGDLDGATVGALAAERARRGGDAFDLKPGEYEVVLAPECVATIAMFLAYYGFNGKSHAEGQSFAELGQKQFDASIDIYDDATDFRALGVGFDAEGTPRRRLELVEAGVTKGLAHDRRTARKAGVAPTGHGEPGSEVWGPLPTHVFLEAGNTSVEDMVASVDRGLYVATFNYCRVLDPKVLTVTGLTRNGTFMIENGKITGAVTNLRFTQSFVVALSQGSVRAIGNDARFADSEFGPGMMHVPSLQLDRWNFTGGAAG
ncbi:MAG: metallopeptidase TldD-related protein [Acidimicrobiia bacterium]|nr:metallopeptidase TldD-related protein [Acidimicrobiia bacterium]